MATGPKDDANQRAKNTRGSASGLFDGALAGSVKESAQQIWLAGMGAFSKAQAEGKSMFDALVKEGTTLQQKTQAAAEGHFGDVADKVSSVASDVQAKAGEQWGKLESIFEERTAKALQKLGVPSSKDMQAMQDRIDALTAQLASERRPPTSANKKAAPTEPSIQAAATKRSSARTTRAKPPGVESAPLTTAQMQSRKDDAVGSVGEKPVNGSKPSAKKLSAKKTPSAQPVAKRAAKKAR